MSRAVVILGAGSSADFGVPILSRIFSDRYARAYLRKRPEPLEALNNYIWSPRGLKVDTAEQGPTVEDILTMLRDWETAHSRDPSRVMAPPDISSLRHGIYCVIQRAVFVEKSSSPGHLNPLIKLCRSQFEHTTWATFNWDCIFESSYYYSSDQPWRSGLRGNPTVAVDLKDWRQGSKKHLLLKLHGGINWWMQDDHLNYLSWGKNGSLQDRWAAYEQGDKSQGEPVILEPSFYKYTDSAPFRILKAQWSQFFHNLLQADYVIIVGYSLLDLDTYAREMILTAFQINRQCRRLVIDPSHQICERYKQLLGTRSATCIEETLSSFNNEITDKVYEAFPTLEGAA